MAQSTDGVSATLALMGSEVATTRSPAPRPCSGRTLSGVEGSGPEAQSSKGAAAAEDPASDRALVRRAQAGDEQAFAQLIDHNRRAVFRAAYAALGSAEEADDVAQETFLAVYQKLQGFRGDAAFRTWLLAIAWRKALDRRRSLSRWLRLTVRHGSGEDDRPELVERVAATNRSQEENLAAGDLERTLKRLIAALPRKLRDAILLVGADEYSYDQIGAMLGAPVGTVKWRVSEARRILKQKLAALGYAHD
jgi:RNA polymerase sigma-70 factor, ECF subfamily